MSTFSVFGLKFTTCTQRVLFAVAECNAQADLDFHQLEFAQGQLKAAEHLKRQPFGKVPTAEVDGVPFFESRAICRILAEKYRSPIVPTDLKKKAVFEQWASLESNTLVPLLDPLMAEVVFKPMKGLPTDQEVATKSRVSLTKILEVLNEQLGKSDFIAGDFSLVDVFQASNFQHLQKTEVGKEIFATFPNIAAWWKRVGSRPAWLSVLNYIANEEVQWKSTTATA